MDLTQASPGFPGLDEDGDRLGHAVAVGDFNNDGFDDLAAGAPSESLNVNGDNIDEAGAIYVLYGSEDRLSTANAQSFSSTSAGFLGTAEDNDRLGEALAAGDFDGDGFDDLAIGVPFENLRRQGALFDSVDAGIVYVLRGGASGLSTANMYGFTQEVPGFIGGIETGDKIGASLAAGDFNCDGVADLAIGAPDEDVGDSGAFEVLNAGAVYVVFGSPGAGLTTSGMEFWHQGQPGVPGALETGDQFGFSLASGALDDDDCDELIVGMPFEDIDTGESFALEVNDGGAVIILRGSSGGLTSSGSSLHTKSTPRLNNFFGHTVAAGDIDDNGVEDVVIGIPGHKSRAGALQVLYHENNGAVGLSTLLETQLVGAIGMGWAVTVAEHLDQLPETGREIGWISRGGGFGRYEPVAERFVSTGTSGTGTPDPVICQSMDSGDFNGDGVRALVFGCPGWGAGGRLRIRSATRDVQMFDDDFE